MGYPIKIGMTFPAKMGDENIPPTSEWEWNFPIHDIHVMEHEDSLAV